MTSSLAAPASRPRVGITRFASLAFPIQNSHFSALTVAGCASVVAAPVAVSNSSSAWPVGILCALGQTTLAYADNRAFVDALRADLHALGQHPQPSQHRSQRVLRHELFHEHFCSIFSYCDRGFYVAAVSLVSSGASLIPIGNESVWSTQRSDAA